ncbi:MAG: carboxypeptidase regulatory-like domain-containing protein [Planctomycetes bacterium]|nr:carboxypeptidase regulatory-like domain-containing protein [Planctomycetota bacterium]
MKRGTVVAAVLAIAVIGTVIAVRLFQGNEDVDVSPVPAPEGSAPVAARAGAPPPASKPVLRERGLAGCVIDGKTRRPLAGLAFRVRLSGGTRTETREATADEEGRFRLAGVPQGEYRVIFEHPAFFPVETEVAVGGEKESAPLEIVFERGVTVRGSVRPLGGGEPQEAMVEWVAVEDPTFVRRAVCPPGGAYELGGLEPGRYWVRVVPHRLAALWRDAKPEEVRLEDAPEATRDFEANLGSSLFVRVTRAGAPVGGAAVRFAIRSRGRGMAGFLDPTDPDGGTVLHGLPRTGTLELEIPSGPHGGARRDVDLSHLPRAVSLELGET